MPDLRTDERYATAVGALWSGLSGTLGRLERIAAHADLFLEGDAVEELRRLQYRLHAASEDALGLTPPAGAEDAHRELAGALESARDATGELAETLELDGQAEAAARIYEWRGALFRVRLARRRLTAGDPATPTLAQKEPEGTVAPLIALLLSLAGTSLFLAGATLAQWPLWASGALILCSSLLVYRP